MVRNGDFPKQFKCASCKTNIWWILKLKIPNIIAAIIPPYAKKIKDQFQHLQQLETPDSNQLIMDI
jgi:hypothetical protein